MVTVAASTKIHAFALAEQLQKHQMLDKLITSFASTKNGFAAKFIRRVDTENIDPDKIATNIMLAIPIGFFRRYSYIWNEIFDRWASGKLKKLNSLVFIGWSGMSLHCIQRAKQLDMITILERGSSHILFQNEILKEEYRRMGKSFSIHSSVIKKELKEYQEADYISVPSFFVRDSFINKGIMAEKIFVNPYGAGRSFIRNSKLRESGAHTNFRIVYLGTISVRKGLLYFFRALEMLDFPEENYDVLIVGNIDREMETIVNKYKRPNWKITGHVDYQKLPEYLETGDIAVQPSLEEGLSLVIPQMMACGIPVIITPNTGGQNIISDQVNGFIVPIRNPEAIAEKLNWAYHHPRELTEMKKLSRESITREYNWDNYGNRYAEFLNTVTKKRIPPEAK